MKPRQFLFSIFIATILAPITQARADIPTPPTAVKHISSYQSQGVSGPIQTITVWPGAGTNVNFIPTRKIVKKVWLDDLRLLTVDFDGPMCMMGSSRGDENCQNSSSTVIHLRRINPVNIDMPHTDSTLLTVILEAPDTSRDRELHQFRVTYGKGTPLYNTVTIYPDHSQVLPTVEMNGLLTAQLQDVERGLQVAKSRNLLGRSQGNQQLEARVQNFLALVRNGIALQTATERAGVSMALISKLEEFGTTSVEAQQQPQILAPSRLENAIKPSAITTGPQTELLPKKTEQQSTDFATSPPETESAQHRRAIARKSEQPPKSASIPTQQKVVSSGMPEHSSAPVSGLPTTGRSGRSIIPANSSSTQTLLYPKQAINDANAAAFGLAVARHKGQINPNTLTWRQAQGAIRQLRLGKSREEAARLAKIPTSVLSQLIQWGQNRP